MQFIKIQFLSNGKICGAQIEKFLLEKTRIVHQLEGERNFHIFYQLIRGLHLISDSAELGLSTVPEDYLYLSSSSETHVSHVSDADVLKTTISCMNNAGISTASQSDLFQLLSGILHFGNVTYDVDAAEGNIVTGENTAIIVSLKV